MKKITKIAIALIAIGAFCYGGTVSYVAYHDSLRNQITNAERQAVSENRPILKIMREKGCNYCHTLATHLPFYASLPIAKQLMNYDMQLGYKSFDLMPVLNSLLHDTPTDLSDLNKIEWVMEHETMPPARYTALHWSGNMTHQEKAALLNWVKKRRAFWYTTEDMAPKRRDEPVQPIPQSLPVNADKAALGMRLFHDPRLSGDNSISCAHCHQLGVGGVDGRKTSRGVGGQTGPINAPTVFNAVFNIEQLWDGRAADLQAQAGGPPLNPIEMASQSWEEIIGKLSQDTQLSQDFRKVYPQSFTGGTITDAIAEFEKTLITPNSPFDKYLRGDDNALTAQQKRGWKLFKDNKCATCHAGIIMGGRSFEPLGLKRDFAFGNVTTADVGRMNVTREARDRLRQKVPTLRNVAQTAPYFHRGDVPTLDRAVKLMLRYQVGNELAQRDIDDIVAFLKSLDGVYTPYPLP